MMRDRGAYAMAKMNWGGASYLSKIERNGRLYKSDEPGSKRLAKKADEILRAEETRRVTRKEVFAKRTPAGGWTKAQLAKWGVPWPPQKGWIERLTGEKPPLPPADPAKRRVLWGDVWND